MTLRLHRGDGELPHVYWPAEARMKPESRRLYPTIGTEWVEVLLVVEQGKLVWLPTTTGRPITVPMHCLETRGEQEAT